MQPVLLGQEVKRSLNLYDLRVDVGFLERAMRKFRAKPSLTTEDLGKASMVQLRREQPVQSFSASSHCKRRLLSLERVTSS
jgi:hypothetical protein